MKNREKVGITGIGVVSPVGIGLEEFTSGLKTCATNFSIKEIEHEQDVHMYPCGKILDFNYREAVDKLNLSEDLKKKAKRIRNLSKGAQYGVFGALEAWANSGLDNAEIKPERIAIIASGSNTQQENNLGIQNRYKEKLSFLNPNYAINFFDTDIVGALSELLGIKGEAFSVGSASASGNMSLIQGVRLIASGEYDIVLVVAPSMELSIYEYEGFTALGAMARWQEGQNEEKLCNPFDNSHCGFIHGENAGTVVLESSEIAQKRRAKILAEVSGYGVALDSNRNPNASVEGEVRAMRNALQMAGLVADDIDYINAHGSSSSSGDNIETEALLSVGFRNQRLNATKALIGHGVTAAGLVEIVASTIQLNEGFLHGMPNLTNPISEEINWVKTTENQVEIDHLLSNSFGFGGVNSSVILDKAN